MRARFSVSRAIADGTRSLAIERKSIDYVPEAERHGRVTDQVSFWFLGNFHFFTIAIGFVGPSMGLSFGYTALAGGLRPPVRPGVVAGFPPLRPRHRAP